MTVSRSELSAHMNSLNGLASFDGVRLPLPEERALIPGADEAFAAFEAQNAAAAPLQAEARKLSRELYDLRGSKHPARKYDQDREDEIVLRRAQVEAELRRNAQLAKARGLDFLMAVFANPRRDGTRRQAARLALEAHEAALEAHAALEEALRKRDALYVSAGSPSAHEHHQHTQRHAHRDGRARQAQWLVTQMVSEFPAASVQVVADGGEVLTAEQLEAKALESARTVEQRVIAASRERGRRQDIIDRNSEN
ncbi:hypothetical protein [Paenarthrobacter sp. AB444]|uniref:hypothetical protein n=1 Tax=Paenarthrobacter sp. AB444 TaxID=3025681 RepID=UPI002365BC25|nr:hypothetical protein [Paenarthrobacter sp. AB444]MDD7834996.1 hypothetical protein [Paenarthrobacter sp. AB444]